MKSNKVILFIGRLIAAGGAERLMFEEAKYLEKNGFDTYILTFDFKEEALFNQTYAGNIYVFNTKYNSRNLLTRMVYRVLALRKKIKAIKPDIILLSNAWDCIYFYLATLFTPYSYSTHIHGTIFWFHDDSLKYASIYRKAFAEVRESVAGHKEFIPVKPPKLGLIERISREFGALAVYRGVRKAKKIFVLSNQMKWEVSKLYGKDAVVLKGAFPRDIFDYKPKQNIKERVGLKAERMILNVNRLDPRKRVDLLIKAFKQVSENFEDVVLVIGGVGEDDERLKDLVKQLDIAHKVRFIGFIAEGELWDYYASCDVFVHPNWAEFAIAPYEALALQKKVVWSTEMEIDELLVTNKHIFVANPTADDFAQAIERALTTDVSEENDMSAYTWDKYCEGVIRELQC